MEKNKNRKKRGFLFEQRQVTYIEAWDVGALTLDHIDELIDSSIAAEENIGIVNFCQCQIRKSSVLVFQSTSGKEWKAKNETYCTHA